MFSDALSLWYLLLPLALLGGVASGTTGFGIYLVFGPILWALLSPTAALATGLATGLPALALLFYLRDSLHLMQVKRLVFYALPGTVIGITIHFLLSPAALRILAALAIIVLLVVTRKSRHTLSPPLAGLSAGALGSSVGFNGPPASLAFMNQDERVRRANTILSLFLISLMTALAFLITSSYTSEISSKDFTDGYLIGLALIPAVSLGIFIGNRIAKHLGSKIELAALFVSTIGVILLFLRAFALL